MSCNFVVSDIFVKGDIGDGRTCFIKKEPELQATKSPPEMATWVHANMVHHAGTKILGEKPINNSNNFDNSVAICYRIHSPWTVESAD